ncbi:hypothetical protein [Xanthomonas sp. CFBP 7912]|uniref:hypothetical protein n=2 Tax=Xanthomonas TaxID=338 RepID=UPI001F29F021|nr:hypothetical protein [Xanthomonas sp. CFBP 7912]
MTRLLCGRHDHRTLDQFAPRGPEQHVGAMRPPLYCSTCRLRRRARPLPMKQWQRAKVRGINASHERTPQPVLFLVLRFSDAAGGGRSALTLKDTSAAFPKSRQRTLAAFLLPQRLAP